MSDFIRTNKLLPTALNGFKKAIKEVRHSAENLSRGEATPDNVIKLKLDSRNVKVQAVNLKTAMELNKHWIDILA